MYGKMAPKVIGQKLLELALEQSHQDCIWIATLHARLGDKQKRLCLA